MSLNQAQFRAAGIRNICTCAAGTVCPRRRPPVGANAAQKVVRKTPAEWMEHYAKLLGNTVAEDDAPPAPPSLADKIRAMRGMPPVVHIASTTEVPAPPDLAAAIKRRGDSR